MRGIHSSSADTVNAAATAIMAAENRFQQVASPRRRWGGCFSVYWCFRSQRHDKRINRAVIIPETSLPASISAANENAATSSAQALPFAAPPSSPASFLQSEPPSSIQSPVGLFSLSAHTANVYSPGPASIFAIGPYAHETQLVSPPVFSTLTTEPSTAPFTPPPETIHLTTPSSPEVPFAQLLMSSLDSTFKKGDGCEFQSYHLYPGSPIGNLISPSSVCSGTSSPFPDLEFQSSIGKSFPSFPINEPPKLLSAEGLAMRRMAPVQSSGNTELHSKDLKGGSPGNSADESCKGYMQTSHKVSFELSEEQVSHILEEEPEMTASALSETHSADAQVAPKQSTAGGETLIGCYVDESYHDLPGKLIRVSSADRAAKEFKFDNTDGNPPETTVESVWWSNEKVLGADATKGKSWAFFSIKQPGVS